jgi:ATP-binding cassette subfamily B (MDR/TAP) protein 1
MVYGALISGVAIVM